MPFERRAFLGAELHVECGRGWPEPLGPSCILKCTLVASTMSSHLAYLERGQRLAALRRLLDPHTAGEERSMFSELRRDPEFTVLDALCAEHGELGRRLERVEAGDVSAFASLELMLIRHIEKEENGLFPAAIMALDGEA